MLVFRQPGQVPKIIIVLFNVTCNRYKYSYEKNIYGVFFIDLTFNSECIDDIPYGVGACSRSCSFWSGNNKFGYDCNTEFPSACQLPGKVKDYCHYSCSSNCSKGKFLPFRHLFAIFTLLSMFPKNLIASFNHSNMFRLRCLGD